MVHKGDALKEGSARCRKPRRWCGFSDHVREGFYRHAGMGRKCRENFNTTVYDTCARDPENSTNCEVNRGGKTWNVLNTCWDGAWDKVCKANKCFALKSLTDQKCITTCKSYSEGYGPFDECADAWAKAGCPADGVSWKHVDPCENSTEPPSAAETAFGLWVAPGKRDETLGVRLPTPEPTPRPTPEPGTEVPCTEGCVQHFVTCTDWWMKHRSKTEEQAQSVCRSELDAGNHPKMLSAGCVPWCKIPDPTPSPTPEPGTEVPCTQGCVRHFVTCTDWWMKRRSKTEDEAYSECRSELDTRHHKMQRAGCEPQCALNIKWP